MPYLSLTPSVECVDDARSKFYTRVLDRASVVPDWNSSEQMLRPDGEYRWGVVVDHNTDPVTAGAGSCIFLHIWLGPGVGTTGCTAMSQEQLEGLLARLDPARRPLLVQLPRPEYKKLRRHWKLPSLPRNP
jgi:D-alanyl-D-alanine dipeptidase